VKIHLSVSVVDKLLQTKKKDVLLGSAASSGSWDDGAARSVGFWSSDFRLLWPCVI
jgi:hypothetical protein